jgi:hypothetical protein
MHIWIKEKIKQKWKKRGKISKQKKNYCKEKLGINSTKH